MTVHTLPAAELAPVGQTRKGRLTMLLVLLACAAPVIASYFSYYVVRPSARSNYAELIQPTVGIPATLNVIDATGQAVPPLSLKGQWLMVVVAGGACDERCEKLLFAQRQLREMTGREKDRIDRILILTDEAPLRAPIQEALRAGTPAVVLRVQRDALAAWLKPEAGAALEDHIYLVDPMGEWMMRTPVNLDPARFRKDLERLLRASSSWDREGRGS